MKKSELRQIIKEELHILLSEKGRYQITPHERERSFVLFKKEVSRKIKNMSIFKDPHFRGHMQSAYSDYMEPSEFLTWYKNKFPGKLKEGIGLDDIPEPKLLSIASKSKNVDDFLKKLKSNGFGPDKEKVFIDWYNDNMG